LKDKLGRLETENTFLVSKDKVDELNNLLGLEIQKSNAFESEKLNAQELIEQQENLIGELKGIYGFFFFFLSFFYYYIICLIFLGKLASLEEKVNSLTNDYQNALQETNKARDTGFLF
jgi:hypothetical protein